MHSTDKESKVQRGVQYTQKINIAVLIIYGHSQILVNHRTIWSAS